MTATANASTASSGGWSCFLPDLRDALDAVGVLPDEEIDLAGTALLLARVDAPGEDVVTAQEHLTSIARAAAAHHVGDADLRGQADFLARLLAGRLGYRGDSETYEDLANANLLRVIARRRGLPVALSILWLHAAEAAGWDAAGINLPGHVMVVLRAPRAKPVLLDPFREGAVVEGRTVAPTALPALSRRELLLRLQNNIRLRRLAADDLAGAVACARDMLRFAPDSLQIWMDAAALHRRLGDIGAALECYARVTDLGGDGEAGRQARAAIAQLRARLH